MPTPVCGRGALDRSIDRSRPSCRISRLRDRPDNATRCVVWQSVTRAGATSRRGRGRAHRSGQGPALPASLSGSQPSAISRPTELTIAGSRVSDHQAREHRRTRPAYRGRRWRSWHTRTTSAGATSSWSWSCVREGPKFSRTSRAHTLCASENLLSSFQHGSLRQPDQWLLAIFILSKPRQRETSSDRSTYGKPVRRTSKQFFSQSARVHVACSYFP